jgi:F0F1-type ATP synthase membrane subunit c/vacuolar-type H+-ATPase subunit K
MTRTARFRLRTGLIAVSAALLTGCGAAVSGSAAGIAAATSAASSATTPAPSTAATSTAGATTAKKPAPKPSQPLSCVGADVTGELELGDAPSAEILYANVIVTNSSHAVCTIQGLSEVELHTGGDGFTLPLRTIMSTDVQPELVTIVPGEQARLQMGLVMDADGIRDDCYEGASYAYVTLPGDHDLVEAWLPDPYRFPALCGPIEVSPWS